MFEDECDFCRIVTGKLDAEIIFESNDWLAFFPLSPATPGHSLIVPRAHVPDLWAADESLAKALMDGVVHIGRAVQTALQPDGMNLITSAGSAAEQSVFHAHLHVVPRWRADNFGKIWPTSDRFELSEMVDVADRVRAVLSGSS